MHTVYLYYLQVYVNTQTLSGWQRITGLNHRAAQRLPLTQHVVQHPQRSHLGDCCVRCAVQP
jgi:hypothetical protein